MSRLRLPVFDVRLVRGFEARARFDAVLDEHHWLGHQLVGETVRHVAVAGDWTWLAAPARSLRRLNRDWLA